VDQSGTRIELPKIRLRVSQAAAERVLRERIEAIPPGRLVANAADVSTWVAEIRPWVAETSNAIRRVYRPDQLATDFAEIPDLARRPGEELYAAVDRVEAFLVDRRGRLQWLMAAIPETRPTPWAWVRSLSGRSVTEQVVAGLVIAAALAALGLVVGFLTGAFSAGPGSATASGPLVSSPSAPSPTPSDAPPGTVVPTTAPTAQVSSPTTPTVAPSPSPAVAVVADFSEWSGSPEWRVIDGHAFSVGTPSYDPVKAPTFAPFADLPAGDVDITTRIRVIRASDTLGDLKTFGIVARASDRGSDAFGVCLNCFEGSLVGLSTTGFEKRDAQRLYDPRTDWHSYTLRIRGAHLIGLVDGREVFDAIETEHAGDTGVGLWATGVAVEVESFTITPST
jgi:hypothetical protein